MVGKQSSNPAKGHAKYFSVHVRALAAIVPAALLLAGCLTPVHPETMYRLTSDPEGADIYMGSAPDQLEHYVTTPFERRTSESLNWSQQYFQARKEGYVDSEVHQQPTFMMGHPTTIHFDLERDTRGFYPHGL